MKKIIVLLATIGCLSFGLSGCFLTPYVPDVQQGNELTAAQVNSIKIGMSKTKVLNVLGQPLLKNAFDQNYWSYVYTIQKNGGKMSGHSLNLTFKHGRLVKIS